jgi:hypothetical protein
MEIEFISLREYGSILRKQSDLLDLLQRCKGCPYGNKCKSLIQGNCINCMKWTCTHEFNEKDHICVDCEIKNIRNTCPSNYFHT